MDILTFISQIIESITWPVTVLALAFIFKDPLSLVLQSIESLTYKDTLVKFAKGTEQIEKKIEEQIPLQQMLETNVADGVQVQEAVTTEETETEQAAKLPRDDFDKIYMELERSPQLAVMKTWTALEFEAIFALKRFNYFRKKGEFSIAPISLVRALKETGILDNKQIQIFTQLRKLRNIAVHRVLRPMPEEMALSYIDAAKKVYQYLKNKNP